VQHRDDLLQFTSLLMVDGRQPLLGSDRAKVVAAIQQALKNPPEVALDFNLDGTGNRKTVWMKIAVRSPEVAGRELLIGVALTEDPVTTKVLRGENAGLTLVEHHVVRRLEYRAYAARRVFPSAVEGAFTSKSMRRTSIDSGSLPCGASRS
jgi:hypothetical protein